jgi:mono/diheme cytochrome c family protein
MQLPSINIRKFVALSCLAVVAVAVSACGGSSGSSSSSESTPATTEAPATTAPATTAPATTTAGGGGAVTAAAGKVVFTANCGSCHTLADAGTGGNIGPNLDDLKPDMALVVHQVTNGGGAMPAFGGQLSDTQIKSVAKYVSSVAGKGGGSGSPPVGGTP